MDDSTRVPRRERNLIAIRNSIPLPLVNSIRALYYLVFRTQLRLRSRITDILDRFSGYSQELPPAMLRFRVSEITDGAEFQRIGSGCARLIEESLQAVEKEIAPGMRILDFGCGCGRTIRWLLSCHPNSEFHGVDVDSEAIEWCAKHLQPGLFQTTPQFPPLPFPTDHFDIVYAFSVFTHLDQPMQDLWLSELGRVLKPDGALLFTVHGALAAQWLDRQGRASLVRDGFVHRRSTKLKGLVPEWYNTSWHSEEYILARLVPLFLNARYTKVPGGMQDVVIAWGRPSEFVLA